jgi:RNA polymerase sigma factor (sigma-70 family)
MEKVIIDFFANAADILEHRKDFWDASLFGRFFATSQELIVRKESPKASANSTDRQQYPSVFAKYLDKESLAGLSASIKDGKTLREAYKTLRDKDPQSFRSALLAFLAENPTGTIYDKLPVEETPVKPKAEGVKPQSPVHEQKPKGFDVSDDADRPFFYNHVEFKKLFKLYKKGDKKALDRLIEVNRSLVVSIAHRYKGKGVDFKDLVQEGTIGLLRALEHFDETKSYRFDFYAGFWIARYLINAITWWEDSVRIPFNLISIHRKITKFKEKYEQQYGHHPAFTDIEIDSDVKLEKVAYLDSLPSSLNEITEYREDMDCFPSEHSFVENYDKLNYNRYFINKLFTFISPRSRTIVEACYGLGDYKGRKYTLEEVGDMFGLTRERCRQILEKSVRIMRGEAKKHKEPFRLELTPGINSSPNYDAYIRISPVDQNCPKVIEDHEPNRERKELNRQGREIEVIVEQTKPSIINGNSLEDRHRAALKEVSEDDQLAKQKRKQRELRRLQALRWKIKEQEREERHREALKQKALEIQRKQAETKETTERRGAAVQKKRTPNVDLRVGEVIYYNGRRCVVRNIIVDRNSFQLVIGFSNGSRKTVPYNKSNFFKEPSTSKRDAGRQIGKLSLIDFCAEMGRSKRTKMKWGGKVMRRLLDNNIDTLDKFLAMKRSDFEAMKGIGSKTLKYTQMAFDHFGIVWK